MLQVLKEIKAEDRAKIVSYLKTEAIEFIGEWNDCITNDIMYLKRDVIDVLMENGINKFVLIGENVLNFHASDNCYYEEWGNEVTENGGWVMAINFRGHVTEEMQNAEIQYFVYSCYPYYSSFTTLRLNTGAFCC